jgi:hypothetical protein
VVIFNPHPIIATRPSKHNGTSYANIFNKLLELPSTNYIATSKSEIPPKFAEIKAHIVRTYTMLWDE